MTAISQTERELAAAAMIKASIKEMIAGDEDILLLAIEGETTLLDCVDHLLDAIQSDESMIAGIKTRLDHLIARKARFEDRIETFRRLISRAMDLAERKKLERPCATIIMSLRPQSLIITSEGAVPTEYFIMKPALDRKKLKAALESGELISGASLSNAQPILTIKRT